MSDTEHRLQAKKEAHCFECPVGLEGCAECGMCDYCEHDASLDESELPSSWLIFIEKSKEKVS